MQPQHHEVHIDNDEYEREQQHLAKQIKRVVVLINDHILTFCAVQKRAHGLVNSFNEIRTLCFPSQTLYFVAHANSLVPHKPGNEAMHMPDQKAHATPVLVQWFKGHGDACEAYIANMYT